MNLFAIHFIHVMNMNLVELQNLCVYLSAALHINKMHQAHHQNLCNLQVSVAKVNLSNMLFDGDGCRRAHVMNSINFIS